jgi:hypothetical protein
MRKINVAELEGVALDYAVVLCEELQCTIRANQYGLPVIAQGHNYTTDWGNAGPIIDRVKIKLSPQFWPTDGDYWLAAIRGNKQAGKSPLVAAMRCYVASKLGNVVELPEELFN